MKTFLLFLIFALFFGAVFAEGSSSSDTEDDEQFKRVLTLETDATDNKVFRSDESDGEGEDFKLKISNSGSGSSYRLELEYGESKFEWQFDTVYYFDASVNPTCTDLASNSVYSYLINNVDPFPPCNSTTDANANVVYTCTATLGPNITWVATVTSNPTTVNGVPLTPTTCKLSIYVNDADATYAVALGTRVKSEYDQEDEDESNEERDGFTSQSEKQISFSNAPNAPFLSWVVTAVSGGTTFDVVTGYNSAESDETDRQVNFCFIPQTSFSTGVIDWDPKFSVGNNSAFLSVSFASLLALFFALF